MMGRMFIQFIADYDTGDPSFAFRALSAWIEFGKPTIEEEFTILQ